MNITIIIIVVVAVLLGLAAKKPVIGIVVSGIFLASSWFVPAILSDTRVIRGGEALMLKTILYSLSGVGLMISIRGFSFNTFSRKEKG